MAVRPSRVRTRLAESTSSSAKRASTRTPARIPKAAAAHASLLPLPPVLGHPAQGEERAEHPVDADEVAGPGGTSPPAGPTGRAAGPPPPAPAGSTIAGPAVPSASAGPCPRSRLASPFAPTGPLTLSGRVRDRASPVLDERQQHREAGVAGHGLTRRSPWWRSTTIRQEMSSPRPVPSPTGLVVKNGSKMRATARPGCRGRCRRSRPRRGRRRGRVRTVSVPVAVHRVDGVVDEVGPDLVELGGVGRMRRAGSGRSP